VPDNDAGGSPNSNAGDERPNRQPSQYELDRERAQKERDAQQDKRAERREKITLAVAVFGVFVAAVGIVVSYMQWDVMHQQLSDARAAAKGQDDAVKRALKAFEDQANALTNSIGPATTSAAGASKDAARTAQDTLATSRTFFRTEQRPYLVTAVPVFLTPLSEGKQATANIYFKNIGKTPAVRTFQYAHLIPYHAAGRTRDDFRKWIGSTFDSLRHETIGPALGRKDVAPGDTSFTTVSTDKILSSDDIAKIQRDGEITLFYVGLTDYTDAYKVGYRTEFCYMFFGDDPKTWHICDSHNIVR
jgi:hypothetical protein